MRKQRTIKIIDGIEYVFDRKSFRKHSDLYIEERNKVSKYPKKAFFEELSDACNYSDETIRKWYRTTSSPDNETTIQALCSFLGINESELLKKKEDNTTMNITITNESMDTNATIISTLKLLSLIQELSNKSKNKFLSFNSINESITDSIIYDDETNQVILDSCVDELHHDIISTYEEYINNTILPCTVQAFIEDDDEYIVIHLEDNTEIVIENGTWYYC